MVKPYYNPAILTAARERKGLSKRDVSKLINRPWMAVYRSEIGTETSPKTLRDLCALYEISLSEVLDTPPAITN